MDADDLLWGGAPQFWRNECAPIATLRAIALIAQPPHQLGPSTSDARCIPPGLVRWAGEPVARNRRDDHVECVGRITTRGARIGQWADHVKKLHDGTGPAMREDQWQRVWFRRAHMDEIHIGAV